MTRALVDREAVVALVEEGAFNIGCTAIEAEGVVRRTRDAIAAAILALPPAAPPGMEEVEIALDIYVAADQRVERKGGGRSSIDLRNSLRAHLLDLVARLAGRGDATPLGIVQEVAAELRRAQSKFGPQASAHEGYAVILEELDELWDEIKKNRATRDNAKMRAEAIQVAAMAARFVIDVCDSARGGVRAEGEK